LSNGLQNNTVIESLFLSHIYIHYLTKTLTTLDLEYIGIGDQGMEYLSNALENNKVGHTFENIYLNVMFLLNIRDIERTLSSI
jgi:hypothetical protein